MIVVHCVCDGVQCSLNCCALLVWGFVWSTCLVNHLHSDDYFVISKLLVVKPWFLSVKVTANINQSIAVPVTMYVNANFDVCFRGLAHKTGITKGNVS